MTTDIKSFQINKFIKAAAARNNQIHLFIKMSRFVCEFEVFGRVQGVFFRKYTKMQADRLGLAGWCQNTRDDTVKGEIEGDEENINKMKSWLQTTGSPQSRIEKAIFSANKAIDAPLYQSFNIRK